MENVDKIRALRSNAEALSTFFDRFNAKVKEPGRDCDKHDAGFGVRDDRFRVFELKLSFDAYHGYYGNSGCSTFTNGLSSTELVRIYMEKVIIKHQDALLKEAAVLMLQEADSKKAEALKELADLKETIEGV